MTVTPHDGSPPNHGMTIAALRDRIIPLLRNKLPPEKARWASRFDVVKDTKVVVSEFLSQNNLELNLLDQRDLVTATVNGFLASVTAQAGAAAQNAVPPAAPSQAITAMPPEPYP